MRYLLLADIHANAEALDVVLACGATAVVDRVVVLGDIVGYGADPNAVVDRIRAIAPYAILRGNHDKVAAGIEPPTAFSSSARASIEWTSATLTSDNKAWLAALPAGPLHIDAAFQACHGSPADEDAYLFEEVDAVEVLRDASHEVCTFGHTHVQIAYALNGDTLSATICESERARVVSLDAETTYLINPGAVGQPRDRDPRAAFAILDTDSAIVTLHRVAYPVPVAQAKILQAGLPPMLAERLATGR